MKTTKPQNNKEEKMKRLIGILIWTGMITFVNIFFLIPMFFNPELAEGIIIGLILFNIMMFAVPFIVWIGDL